MQKFAREKQLEGVKSLSQYNPHKVGLILYLFSQGVSQTQMVRKYHLSHRTIKHTVMEYADHLGKWRELGSKINGRLFLELSSIEEDMVEDLHERLPLIFSPRIWGIIPKSCNKGSTNGTSCTALHVDASTPSNAITKAVKS